jgi:hypothetical protein
MQNFNNFIGGPSDEQFPLDETEKATCPSEANGPNNSEGSDP